MKKMTNTKSVHQFYIGGGAKLSASKNDANFYKQIENSLKGGQETFDWFQSNLATANKIWTTVAMGGDSVWLDGIDKHTGFATKTVVEGNASITIGMYITEEGKKVIENGNATGTLPEEYGFSYVVLVLNQGEENEQIKQLATNSLLYSGAGIPNVSQSEGLRNLIKGNIKIVKNFLKETVKFAFDSGEKTSIVAAKGVITEGAENAAKNASVTGEEIAIGEGKTIVADIGFGVVDAVGLVLALSAIALNLVLILLSKRILNYVQFYNQTPSELEFSICWIHKDAALVSGPMLPNTPISIPGLTPAWTPPWVIGFNPVHSVDMIFGNTDTLKGLAYVLKARPNGDFPGFNILVQIPSLDNNSMAASFELQDNCAQYWKDNKDKNEHETLSIQSSDYTLTIATNQISGKSPSPVDGSLGYNYEHLIVLKKN